MFEPGEIAEMIRDTGGVPVVFGAMSTWGHFEVVDELVMPGAEIVVGAPTLVIETDSLPGLEQDDELLVDGRPWAVRYTMRIRDGRETRILLREP